MKFFEDLRIGERRELGSHTFTAEGIKAFARRYDPQLFHLDEEAAARSHFGGLCASGWQTGAVCMRLIALGNQRDMAALQASGQDVPNIAPSPGVRDLRWFKPVYAGDTISYALEIKNLRDTGPPGYGLVVSQTTGTNQAGELVYSAQGAVFVERKRNRKAQ